MKFPVSNSSPASDWSTLFPLETLSSYQTRDSELPPLEARRRARIGIFDSGVGGLTVLRELYRQLPNESILYFGDTARLPYGTRSQTEILQFVREIVTWMIQRQVKMIVMACNTSSALALETIRAEFPLPILGLILPGARAAIQCGKRIGVIATPATVASGAYHRAILEANATAQTWQSECPEFVPLIEQNRIYDPHTVDVSRQYLAPLMTQEIDTLVYGCTHYPLLAPVLRMILPRSVTFVDPAVHIVAAAARELDLLELRNNSNPLPTEFYVSGCPEQFAHLSAQWLGFAPDVSVVRLTELVYKPTSLELVE